MNRIDKKFVDLRAVRKKAFIAFLTAGDPSLPMTEKLVFAFEKNGVDIIELGVPFSDPLADGPIIQAASQRALGRGVSLCKILESVRRMRARTRIPIALMTYFNPVFHYGVEEFVNEAKACGVDGIIIPDLPPEEGRGLSRLAQDKDLAMIYFLTPTTTSTRMKKIINESTGFVYYVSVAGVTGARQKLPSELLENVRAVKKLTMKPICVGFGVSTPEQVQSLLRVADGVIVGSAIVETIALSEGRGDLVSRVVKLVRELSAPLLRT